MRGFLNLFSGSNNGCDAIMLHFTSICLFHLYLLIKVSRVRVSDGSPNFNLLKISALLSFVSNQSLRFN